MELTSADCVNEMNTPDPTFTYINNLVSQSNVDECECNGNDQVPPTNGAFTENIPTNAVYPAGLSIVKTEPEEELGDLQDWKTDFWRMAQWLRETKCLCDATLQVSDSAEPSEVGMSVFFTAHSFMLASASKHLKLQVENTTRNCAIQIDKVSSSGVKGVLDYIYGQEPTDLSDEAYIDCLNAASVMEVPHAVQYFTQKVQKSLMQSKPDVSTEHSCTEYTKITNDVGSRARGRRQGLPRKAKARQTKSSASCTVLRKKTWSNIITKATGIKGKTRRKIKCDKSVDKKAESEDDTSLIRDSDKSDEEFILGEQSLMKTLNKNGRRFLKKKANKHQIHRKDENQKTFNCIQCQSVFCSIKEFKKHLKSSHSHNGRYICNLCGKDLSTRASFLGHQRVHTNEFPYLCSICGKSFRLQKNLRCHIKTHEPSFQLLMCDYPGCRKTYKNKASLKNHKMTVHQNKLPFQCHTCGKSFRWRECLNFHMKTHQAVREVTKYKCPTCSRHFNSTFQVKRHQVIHTQDKPYQCELCGAKFTQQASVNKHQRENCPRRSQPQEDVLIPSSVKSTKKSRKKLKGTSLGVKSNITNTNSVVPVSEKELGAQTVSSQTTDTAMNIETVSSSATNCEVYYHW